MGDELTIVIDTREQTPLSFADLPGVSSVSGALQSGDYSIQGLEEHFAVERKSIEDLVGSCTGDRDRFKRELHRLRGFAFARLLVVGTQDQIELQRYRSKASPKAILASLTAFEVEYNVPVVFVPTAAQASRWLARAAWYFKRSRQKGIVPFKGSCEIEAVKTASAGVLLESVS
jgi:ERCC4-type nuclease